MPFGTPWRLEMLVTGKSSSFPLMMLSVSVLANVVEMQYRNNRDLNQLVWVFFSDF